MFKGLCCGGKLESSVEVVLKFLVVFEGPANGHGISRLDAPLCNKIGANPLL
jgi:hypothetical protein